MATKYSIGRNCDVTVNGHTMTITIDLSADGAPSSTGKTEVISTSGGASVVGTSADGRPCKLNCTVFVPIAK